MSHVTGLDAVRYVQRAVKGVNKPIETARFARLVNYGTTATESNGQILQHLHPELLVPHLKTYSEVEFIERLL